MTSYEIRNQIDFLAEMKVSVDEETGEYKYTDEEIKELEVFLHTNKEQKLNSIQDFKLSLNDDILRFKNKKSVQDANIKRVEKKQEYLKELQNILLGNEKLKTDEFNFYYTTTERLNVRIEAPLDSKFYEKVETTVLNKAFLKKALSNGEIIQGAELVESKNLVVR
tara:strand:+ start:307 stop:804 length:498 start_codon:yes stop_codon:yes gene_type:complete